MIWRRIRNLSLEQLFILFKLFLKNPRFLLPSLKATSESLQICNQKFGNRHKGNSRENAFRHALWNYLICDKCFSVIASEEKATDWAKKFTDLHEKLAPNEEKARKMDLHNNLIGRNLFLEQHNRIENIVPVLEEMMKKASKIEETGVENAKDRLVFIDN